MPGPSAITHRVIFDLDNNVIKIEDRTNYGGSYSGAIHGVITITKNGAAFNTPGAILPTSSGAPDLIIPATEYSLATSIQASRVFEIANPITPTTSDVWTVDYSVYPSSGLASEEQATQVSFTYGYTAPIISLSLTAATAASQITSTDSTDYTSGSVYLVATQTRTHSLNPPQGAVDAITGVLLPSPVDSGSSATM